MRRMMGKQKRARRVVIHSRGEMPSGLITDLFDLLTDAEIRDLELRKACFADLDRVRESITGEMTLGELSERLNYKGHLSSMVGPGKLRSDGRVNLLPLCRALHHLGLDPTPPLDEHLKRYQEEGAL